MGRRKASKRMRGPEDEGVGPRGEKPLTAWTQPQEGCVLKRLGMAFMKICLMRENRRSLNCAERLLLNVLQKGAARTDGEGGGWLELHYFL